MKEPDITPEEAQEDKFLDKLDLLKYFVVTHHDLKKHITSDFKMAHCEEKDKTMVITYASNAYYNLDLFARLKLKTNTQDEKNRLDLLGASSFNHFMIPVKMVVTMNENVTPNPILGHMMKGLDEDQKEPEATPDEGFIDQLWKKWTKKKKEEED